MNERRAARFLIRLFPGEWRGRYGEEFTALLAQTGISVGVAFDVLVAALDAHLNSNSTPRRWPLMIQQLRRSELTVFVCWVVLAMAGASFAKMSEDPPLSSLRLAQLGVGLAYDTIIVGGVIGLAAIMLGGAPIAIAIALDGLRRGRWLQLGLLASPIVAVAAWAGVTILLVGPLGPPVDAFARVFFFVVWVTTFIVAVLSSAIALGVAALNAEINGELYRRATAPAFVTALAMFLVAAATLVWGIAIYAADPTAFWGGGGFLATSTAANWLAIVVVMAGATAVALRSAARLRAHGLPGAHA
jgi:hypothetical protein